MTKLFTMKAKSSLPLFIFVLSLMAVDAQVVETINLPPAQKTGGMPLMEAFQLRKSQRSFSSKELSNQQISNLLWAAYGINRPNEFRTVPAAKNWFEYDIYLLKSDGWFLYDVRKHALLKMGNEDLRIYGGTQDFVKAAPVILVYVADFGRMNDTTDELRKFFSAVDLGYISQNVYLWSASEGLATIILGQVDKPKVHEVLKLKPDQQVILSQPVGYPGQ
ncbi:MAG: SagB/ThcOx family dehydrogenase [Acholeplasmataceae bacterium]|nr:SagB/ThcOx family dehydrogenase [Acholeplasmataceae bacterium]